VCSSADCDLPKGTSDVRLCQAAIAAKVLRRFRDPNVCHVIVGADALRQKKWLTNDPNQLPRIKILLLQSLCGKPVQGGNMLCPLHYTSLST
jgi:hypothetical protein